MVRRGIGAAAALTLSWAVANAEGPPGGDLPPAQPATADSVAAHNAHIQAMANVAPRGAFPRAFIGEQSYWTVVGVDGGAESGLLSEDGAIELGKGGASVEPVVIEDGRSITWADVSVSQSLKDGYLPIPSVTWRRPGWTLRITAFAAGEARTPRLWARYAVRNLTRRPLTLVLALAVRPLQVNGPGQFLNTPGGFSPIDDLAWAGAWVAINGRRRIVALPAPDRFVTPAFAAGVTAAGLLANGPGSPARDADGLATGALVYTLRLPPRGGASVGWMAPLAGATVATRPSPNRLSSQEAAVAGAWRRRLRRVTITVPEQARYVADTLSTSLATMLISRDGPILRPGTRSYDRSWIRDGAMISEALLRMGHGEAAADYLRWYAPFQFASGQAPCCIDARGADPTKENDGDGEFIFLTAEVYRYGHDKALLRSLWPRVLAAARYMDGQRRSERPAGPNRSVTFGLLPPSISHEGYSAKPAYSYWDDFWALRGYDDAVFLAGVLGEREEQARLMRSRAEFGRDLYASLLASSHVHGVDYIPGAADLGDFDPTSTTIALAPGGLASWLPKDLRDNTFDRYWRQFIERRDGDRAWDAYTPYELRAIGTFVRLGQRDRAWAALDYFMKDRRPAAWNGWAEVVGREARKPRFVGDMPHAWVASDFARSVLDMFAFDRASDGALVIGAGVPARWFEGGPVGVKDLRTPYGRLTWSARSQGGTLRLRVAGDARPPGGFVFAWPFAGAPGVARFNGRRLEWSGRTLRVYGTGELAVGIGSSLPASKETPGLSAPHAGG